jgi:hypothetical protein
LRSSEGFPEAPNTSESFLSGSAREGVKVNISPFRGFLNTTFSKSTAGVSSELLLETEGNEVFESAIFQREVNFFFVRHL